MFLMSEVPLQRDQIARILDRIDPPLQLLRILLRDNSEANRTFLKSRVYCESQCIPLRVDLRNHRFASKL